MPRQWLGGLSAATRERYPALLSYAAMLTPDMVEARTLTDNAIVAVMGSLRAPRGDLERDIAIRDSIAGAYADKHRADARASQVPLPPSVSARESAANAAYAPPPSATTSVPAPASEATATHQPLRQEIGHDGIGLGLESSPLASALAHLSPAERIAAVSWWIDGLSADDVADRLGTTHNSAVDLLHRAGIALAAATGASAPRREHFAGGGDVVTVEVSDAGGRR